MPATAPAPAPRGHWPRGRLRNDADPAEWLRTRLAVAELIRRNPRPGARSIRALAAHLAVDPKTAWRWIAGEDHPTAAVARRVERWLARQLGLIARGL